MLTVFASCVTLVITVDQKKKKKSENTFFFSIFWTIFHFGPHIFFSLLILVQQTEKIIFNLIISIISVMEISKRSAPLIRWQT